MIVWILAYLLTFIAVCAVAAFAADRILRAPGHSGPVSDHFDGAKFLNVGLGKEGYPERTHGSLDVTRWLLSRDKNRWEKRKVAQSKPAPRVDGGEVVATFINHATVLLQTEGLNIVTDPIYARRASPVRWVGPKRFAAPGVAWKDLPVIDLVLLSHNHYDHMDVATLRRLRDAFDPLIIAPLGNAAFLRKKGFANVAELDWWQSRKLTRTTLVQAVPAQHFSARALSDRDRTLWCGYVLRAVHGDIYLAGDTGYGPFADEIARAYPRGFRFGLLPIGAYEPQWFMREVHMSPDDALRLKDRLGVREAMAIHFGTFKLADDAQDQPRDRLALIREGREEEIGRFEALDNGASMTVAAPEED